MEVTFRLSPEFVEYTVRNDGRYVPAIPHSILFDLTGRNRVDRKRHLLDIFFLLLRGNNYCIQLGGLFFKLKIQGSREVGADRYLAPDACITNGCYLKSILSVWEYRKC